MTRRGLVPVTLLTVLFTGLTLARAGWFAATSFRTFPHRGDAHSHARAHDPLGGEAAFRWRHCQATHWRACLLQQ